MPSKSERLLNLTIALLSTKRYLPKEYIRRAVAGYEDQNDAAFERMFERDKDELRAVGIPIETGNIDHFFSDEKGYRIPPSAFELPPIELDADEAAVLGVAARAWRETSMAAAAQSAMSKLRGAGIEPDTSRLAMLDPVVTAREPSFPLWAEATRLRRRVRFRYRASADADEQTRTLEPWAVTSTRGRWYVVGRDVDRADTRMFRLSRIVGDPKMVSKPAAYQIPDDLDVRALTRSLEPPPTREVATVAIRAHKAPRLRRQGRPVEPPADVTLPEGFEVYEVKYAHPYSFAEDLAALAADVVVLAPATLRDGVVRHLRAVARTHPHREQAA